jgi:3-methylfumaryl-CoA hydratase
MTSHPELDVDHLRSWIGQEDAASETITADLVQKFRATFDKEPGALQIGDSAPHLIHWCLAQPAALTSALGPDGHPERGGFLPPVPLPRRMWAGGSFVFHGGLKIGDAVRRVSRIDDVSVKQGRSGTLCFVTVKHEIDAGGRPVLSETHDIVYRGLGGGGAPQTTPAPEASHRRKVIPSAPFLFRYSALTFNGHRIHYDHPYTTQVEGYPGLVVHGPLQATLLLRYAAEFRGAPPARFSFRAMSPLFDTEPFFLNADESGGGLKLWTSRAGGPLAMTAEADW